MRTLLVLFILLLPVCAWAEPAQWKAEEMACIAKCPKPKLTWRAGESEETWRKRTEENRAYDACYVRCAQQYMEHYRGNAPTPYDKIPRRPGPP